MKQFKNITVLLAILFLQKAVGQYDQEIIAEGPLQLSVGKVFKIAEQPKTIDSTFLTQELSYQLIPRRAFSEFKPTVLTPAKIEIKPKAPKLYKAYTKLGIGTFTTPLAQLYYNSMRTNKGAWGFSYDHLSSAGGVSNAPQSRFSDNAIDFWGRAFLRKHVAEGKFGWNRNHNHFYGMDLTNSDLEIPDEDIEQTFNEFGGGVGIKTYHRDSTKISYAANLNGYYLTAREETKETHIAIDGWVNKREGDYIFEIGGELISNNYQSLSNRALNYLDTTGGTMVQSQIENTYFIFTAKPKIRADVGNLQADVGLDINYENQISGEFKFYPQAFVSYELFDGIIVPYIHYTGGLERNTYNSLRKDNPFLLNSIAFDDELFDLDPDLRNTNNRFDLNGGIKARFSNTLSLSGNVRVHRFKDLPMFVNDTTYSNENRFGVIYDDGRLLGISGQIAYRYNEFLNLTAGLELQDFNMDNEEEAWHRPETKFTAGVIFDYNDKLVAKFDAYMIGKRFVKSLLPIEDQEPLNDGSYKTTVDAYFDASLSAEYRYTKRLSAFLELNNITGGRYERWYRYRTQPFQVMGGISYSF
ncbi:MAG: hypothetical protein AAF487_02240 [Bacteroidota bacterium]